MATTPRRIQQYWSVRELVYRFLDGGAVLAGVGAAVWATGVHDERFWLCGVVAVLMFHFVAEISGLYRNWRGVSLEKELICAVSTWGFVLPLLITAAYLFNFAELFPRRFPWFWFAATPCVMVALRTVLRRLLRTLRSRGYNTRRYAVVGINSLGFGLVEALEESPDLGMSFLGFYDDRPAERTDELPENLGSKIGNIDELVEHARRNQVDMIYITFPMRAEERIREILGRLGDTTASVYIVPDFFVFELLHSRWTNVGGLPVVSVYENPFYGIDGLVKRSLDMALACMLLVLLALPMAAIAMAVKLTSRGPVLFRQRRYGLDGREIWVWKFRSMRVCQDQGEVKQATRNDSRITPLGAFLRKTSLDELPQLFNVIEGSMSLVGPRPHANVHNEEYRALIQGYMLRHKVRPGITGLAQVNGLRGETDTLDKMSRRVEYDLRYIREWSLWMDIKILFRTLMVAWRDEHAY